MISTTSTIWATSRSKMSGSHECLPDTTMSGHIGILGVDKHGLGVVRESPSGWLGQWREFAG